MISQVINCMDSRGRCGQEQRKPEWGGFLGENSASLATSNIASTTMDTSSAWWTEDFVDLTSFTTTVVDERGQPQLSSMASEPEVNSAMKMDEITLMEDVPSFSWLEDGNAALVKGSIGLTPSQETNSGKLYPSQSGKVITQRVPTPDFRKPVNSSLVGRRDAQLKLDLSLAVTESPPSSNSPSCFVQALQVPTPKKEPNFATPDLLQEGLLTDKFNLMEYVLDEKSTNVLNTPEIKPEQLDVSPFPLKLETPSIITVKVEPKEVEELFLETPVIEPLRNVKREPQPVPVKVKEEPTKKSKGAVPRRRPSKLKDKVAVVEPRIKEVPKIKIELDEYRPVIFRSKVSSASDNILYPSKKRKISTASEDSTYTDEKYRELRDKNNEASRRSRMNRKSREVEMKYQADELEATNMRLKSKADELQRLVDRLRATLMEVMVRKC